MSPFDENSRTNDGQMAVLVDVDAEDALIGNILAEPKAFDLIAWMGPEFFGDPVRASIWGAIKNLRKEGRAFGPAYLGQFFANEEAIKGAGGERAFLDLANAAIAPMSTTKDLAARILSLHYRRHGLECGEKIVARAMQPDFETPPERLLSDFETILASARNVRTSDNTVSAAVSARRALDHARSPSYGVKSGFTRLDRATGGFKPGEMTIIAGRPSMGKTAMGLTVGINAALGGKNVLFFSLEMIAEELMKRVISRFSGQPVHSGDMADDIGAENAVETISRLPFHIDDSAGITAIDISARAAQFQRRNGLDLILIDHLSKIKPGDNKPNRVHQIEEITGSIKNMANSLNVPVILLCQLSRAVESRDEKRPELSDLRDSGAIEQDADVVMFIYRDEYYLRDGGDGNTRFKSKVVEAEKLADIEALKGKAELIIAKNRQGVLDTVNLNFNGREQVFYE